MNVQFSIEDIRLLNLQYSVVREEALSDEIEGKAPEKERISIPVELTCSSDYQAEKSLLKVTVAISIKDPNPGYRLSAEIGGIFHLHADPEEDLLNRLRLVSCPAILFPYLREAVSEVSRRGGFEPFYLPPANFIKMYESAEEKAGTK